MWKYCQSGRVACCVPHLATWLVIWDLGDTGYKFQCRFSLQ
jgi:hypothetical protein